MVASTAWDTLVQDSERLRAEDNFGIPHPQRSLAQIQEHARQLRQNSGGISTLSERRAAARLVGSTIDTADLTRKTVEFNVEPAREDLFPEDTWTVEEYMQNMARKHVAVAIQTRMDEESRHFEGFMTQCMDTNWGAERKRLLDSVTAPAWQRNASSSDSSPSQLSRGQLRAPGQTVLALTNHSSTAAARYGTVDGSVQLTVTQRAIVDATRSLVEARNIGGPFDALPKFSAALSQGLTDDEVARSGIVTMWTVLQSQLGALAASNTVDAGQKQKALLRGSLAHLEGTYFQYMRKCVTESRLTSRPGGTGSHSALIRAFLSTLPLSQQFSASKGNCWQVVYLCLRAGRIDEAIEAASGDGLSTNGLNHAGRQLRGWLTEWKAGNCCLPETRAKEIIGECQSAMAAEEVATSVPLAKTVVLVLSMLAGSVRCLEDARLALPALSDVLFSTIEDYMWFQCHVAYSEPSTRHRGLHEDSALQTLQSDIRMQTASYYSRNGARPMQYVVVLLMTLQYSAALEFLHTDAMAGSLRDAAVAVAIVADHDGLVALGGGSPQAGSSAATVIQEWARGNVGPAGGTQHNQSIAPLEYLVMLRAAVDAMMSSKGDNPQELRQKYLLESLVQWLKDTRQFALLGQEAIELFVPSKDGSSSAQRSLLTHAARQFVYTDENSACELFLLAGHFGIAMELVNCRFGKLLRMLAECGSEDVDRVVLDVEGVKLRGNQVLDRHSQFINLAAINQLSGTEQSDLDSSMKEHKQGFEDLGQIRTMLQQGHFLQQPRHQATAVDTIIKCAQALEHWLPIGSNSAARCANQARNLSPYIQDLVPTVIVVTAQALSIRANSPQPEENMEHQTRIKLEQIKRYATALNKTAPAIALPVSLMQRLNMFTCSNAYVLA